MTLRLIQICAHLSSLENKQANISWNTGSKTYDCSLIALLTCSSCVPRQQVATALERLYSNASSTAPASLVVRFGTRTSDGYFGSVAAKQLLLRMKANLLTSGTTKFAVVLGQQVRAPSW